METCIVRVWLPDRPGALGQVAGAVGDVGGEIVGIDILERGAGRAVDELAVEVPDGLAIANLLAAIRTVPEVDIEDVHLVDGVAHDPRADALEIAAIIVGARDRETLLDAVVAHGRRLLGGRWAAVVRPADDTLVAQDGLAPAARWLVAFVEGSRSSSRVARGETGPDDVVWSPLPGTGLALVVGRDRAPFRARERRQVAALARIADTRLVEFSRGLHPSGQG